MSSNFEYLIGLAGLVSNVDKANQIVQKFELSESNLIVN